MSSKKIRTVTCGSCGAAFNRKLPVCPYCGATNLWGNERQYMEGLEETKRTGRTSQRTKKSNPSGLETGNDHYDRNRCGSMLTVMWDLPLQ